MVIQSRSVIAIPPGVTIKEQLQDRGLTQKEFALRMGVSEKHISRLINGDVILTPNMAVRLEMVLGVPAKFWSNLEAIYREKLEKAMAELSMDADAETAKHIPYKAMSDLKWIEPTSNIQERVVNLRKYFEVVSLELLKDRRLMPIACRKLGGSEDSEYALLAWAQKAKLEARSIETEPINISRLNKLVPQMRALTIHDPEYFCTKLKSCLKQCGVAGVFLPHIRGSYLHGATFYDANKIVLGLTVRGKDADRFWFSLFHEIGHIVYGHINKMDGLTQEEENKADIFAQNVLIPSDEYNCFAENKDYSVESVINFAQKINIHPGIVVGRLQKDEHVKYNNRQLNALKIQYVFAS